MRVSQSRSDVYIERETEQTAVEDKPCEQGKEPSEKVREGGGYEGGETSEAFFCMRFEAELSERYYKENEFDEFGQLKKRIARR